MLLINCIDLPMAPILTFDLGYAGNVASSKSCYPANIQEEEDEGKGQ